MLDVIMNSVYIDNEWVAHEYLLGCKSGAWKQENTVEALKWWNIARVLAAEVMGKSEPEDLTMDGFLKEGKPDKAD